MVIEGGGDFPDEAEGEPNFNRDGVAHVGAAVIVLTAIVRMAEIVADAVDVPVAAGAIVDAAGAADGLVAAGGIVDAAGLAGEDTRTSLPRIYTDSHG